MVVRRVGDVWKTNSRGDYWLTKTEDGIIGLHRAIWIKNNGPIPTGYDVHHIDFNVDNNDISNLILLTKSEHMRIHAKANNNWPSWEKGKPLSDETKKKLSEAHKGRATWNKGLKGCSNGWHKGVPRSDETKKKISEALIRRRQYEKSC